MPQTTRLVFGLGSLHHLFSPRARFGLIAAAAEAGLTRFDVAPAYGNGLAEHELGRALRVLRLRTFAVHTKVGIPVAIYPRVAATYAFPAVRLLDVARGGLRSGFARRTFDPDALRESLHGSLRRLGLDRVQRFFLHEPIRPFETGEYGAVVETMERLIRDGKIVEWGIAGPQRKYRGPALLGIPVVQQPLDEWLALPPRERSPGATLYGLNRAWRAGGAGESFPRYVRILAEANPAVQFLVSTNDRARVAPLAGAVP